MRSALVVAMGGFLLGFDSAVVSGVMGPVRAEFDLTAAQQGWTGSCLILGAMFGNASAGPLANRFGRRAVLFITALLFTISALGSAVAPSYTTLVLARILGGLAVGAAILIAPIYIAEIAPPAKRGRLVSFNQLNIVVGISAAFYSNELINAYLPGDAAWRWMLGVEAVPAALYFLLLFTVPRSPRWLLSKSRREEAKGAICVLQGLEDPTDAIAAVENDIAISKEKAASGAQRSQLSELFSSKMSRIMTIALGLAFFQQISGINAIFYYAATIFSKAGAGLESSLRQGTLIGLVNLVFTLIAMRYIDRVGRKPLLLIGTAGVSIALLVTSSAFRSAEYVQTPEALAGLQKGGHPELVEALSGLNGTVFPDRDGYAAAITTSLEAAAPSPEATAAFAEAQPGLVKDALVINGLMVLLAIMLFIASFAVSLGPVMWAMLAEVFPDNLRGAGISVAGLFNSLVSFTVVQLFPWELERFGPATTFLVFGLFGALGFLFTIFFVPETKGRSLGELEQELVRP